MSNQNSTMNDTKQTGGKKFIICVFGESSAGKSTLLRSLFSDIIGNSKYSICDAEGFQCKDRRAAGWYRTGRSRQCVIAIGTPGDSWDVIKANVDFFMRHLRLWDEWFKNYTLNGGRRLVKKGVDFNKKKDRQVEDPDELDMPKILVTAARKPLESYAEWDEYKSEFEVLNIPINADAWYFQNEKAEDVGVVEWMLPVRLIKESLLENIRYIMIKKKLKCYPDKLERKINSRKIRASVSRD